MINVEGGWGVIMIKKLVEGKEKYFYFVFRILVGFMFWSHGMQKIFGAFGGVDGSGGKVALFGLMGVAGTIELVGGLLILLGLFTRLSALIAGVEMLVAYFMAHFPQGMIPVVNKGEPALLFFASFLVLVAYGAGILSLGKLVFKKEIL
tara:strand:+ start:4017 stop:4463 length:447 start_codon:yes stop_codon:yes gene_type:complete